MKRDRISEDDDTPVTYTASVTFKYTNSRGSGHVYTTFQTEDYESFDDILRKAKEKCMEAFEGECDIEDLIMSRFTQIRNENTCYGCVNDRPGQRDHMEIGGCLYQRTPSL